MQANPAAPRLHIDILNTHLQHGADTGECVDHQRDQRAITQASGRARVDGVEQRPRLASSQHLRSGRSKFRTHL
jgi:hypothetical protein